MADRISLLRLAAPVLIGPVSQEVALRVKGNNAVAGGPSWAGTAVAALGLILSAAGVVLFLRARRATGA